MKHMTMKYLILTTIASLTIAGSALAEGGGVAVLDIDAVARELGIEDRVRVDLITMQSDLNTELQRTQATMQNQMSGVEQAAGENPSEEEKRKILATNQQLNSEFNRLKTQATQNLGQERVRMINEFRIRLEPVALMAAKKRDLDVVLMKVTPPVFTYSKSVDITEDTIKLAVEAGMKIELAEPVAEPVVEAEKSDSSEDKPEE
tara:strand:+ start:263 stop:874 length:612 start_codon:yes stop_codon:yes gene_type:complete